MSKIRIWAESGLPQGVSRCVFLAGGQISSFHGLIWSPLVYNLGFSSISSNEATLNWARYFILTVLDSYIFNCGSGLQHRNYDGQYSL